MMQHKNIAILIASAAILVAAAAAALLRFDAVSDDNRAYAAACPALHIAAPQEAAVYVIRDVRDKASLALLSDEAAMIVRACRPSASRPVVVACYDNGSYALWSAAREKTQRHIARLLADSLSGGYRPVMENPDGETRIAHFATTGKRFIHLYMRQGIVGCSYDRNLLHSDSADYRLADAIARSNGAAALSLVVRADGEYHTFSVRMGNSGVRLLAALARVPGYLDGDAGTARLHDLPSVAGSALQAYCRTAQPISHCLTRITPAAPDDSAVIVATIADRSALMATLRPYYTAYGYRMPSDSLARLVPACWVDNGEYLIDVADSTLLASTSLTALHRYRLALRRGDRRNALANPGKEALLTYSATDTVSHRAGHCLPGIDLPAYIEHHIRTAQIIAGDNRHYLEIIVPSLPRSIRAANR